MKKLLFLLLILFSLSAAAVENQYEGTLKLASGKVIKVISHGQLQIPEDLGYGKTFQIKYETAIPLTEKVQVEKEVVELLVHLNPVLQRGNYKTIFIQVNGPYTDKMLTSKNGRDFKFIKTPEGKWEIK